jgi:hypothetical protein
MFGAPVSSPLPFFVGGETPDFRSKGRHVHTVFHVEPVAVTEPSTSEVPKSVTGTVHARNNLSSPRPKED